MYRDLTQMKLKERIANIQQLRYVDLDAGNIGVLTNGAGYSLATIDILKLYGGKPANFLDLGGQEYREKLFDALLFMEKDDDVDSIFLNMFAEWEQVEIGAYVIKKAIQEGLLTKPIMCRLKGVS